MGNDKPSIFQTSIKRNIKSYNKRQKDEIEKIQNLYKLYRRPIEKQFLPNYLGIDEVKKSKNVDDNRDCYNDFPYLLRMNDEGTFPLAYEDNNNFTPSFSNTITLHEEEINQPKGLDLASYFRNIIGYVITYHEHNYQIKKSKMISIGSSRNLYGPTSLLLEEIIRWCKAAVAVDNYNHLKQLVIAMKIYLDETLEAFVDIAISQSEKSFQKKKEKSNY